MDKNQVEERQADRWQIEVFGELRLFRNEQEILFRFPTRKAGALLAFLALNNSAPHSYQRLIEEFWPQAEGFSSLHNALSGLRKLLEPTGTRRGSILISDPAVILAPTVTTDAAQFEAARRAAKVAIEPSEKIAALAGAAQLYRGELMPGYSSPWFSVQREFWRRTLLECVRQLIALLESGGRFEEALRYSRQAVSMAPHSEEARDDLIRVLHRSGQTDEARTQCKDLLSLLRKDRLEPSPVTRDLALQLLYSAGSAPEPPSLDASPAKSPTAPAKPMLADTASAEQSDMPAYLTRFFGRELVLEEITLRLLAPAPKWVTLTGLGGVGKTRLAREAAARMPPPYAGAHTFVSLANVKTPDRIAAEIARSLHLPRTGGSDALASVASAITGKPTLLVLDNMEHLAAGGGKVIETLLQLAPAAALLVTSRFPLGKEHEQVVPVGPLPTPEASDSPERFHAYASAKLFVDRARRAKPDFQITVGNMQAVADLCRSLDGIPLAIELAAARASSLEPAQMLARLSRRFDFLVSDQASDRVSKSDRISETEGINAGAEARHESLWNAIGWSYHLLPPDVQRFFRALSVFRGGWTVDHARAIAAEPLAKDYLRELSRQDLAVTALGPTRRFHMLETLREYGAAQLLPPGQEVLSAAHLDYFLTWASRARKGLTGAGQTRWLERLDQEHDNLRAALRWCSAQEERRAEQPVQNRAELGLRLAERLWEFWNLHAHWSEGRQWLTLFLERTQAQGATQDRTSAYNGAGVLAIQQGDYIAARKELLTGLEMARSLGPKIEGDILSSLGYLASKPDNTLDVPREARAEVILAKYQKAMREQPELADQAEVATFWPLLGLGKRELDLGNRSAAISFFKESLAVCEKFGDKQGVSHPLTFLAQIASDQGNFEAARDYLTRGLRLRQELKDVAGIAVCLEQLGRLAHAQQDWERCVRLYGAAWAGRVLTNALVSENLQEYQRQTDPAKARLGAAAFLSQWQEGASLTREQALIFSPET